MTITLAAPTIQPTGLPVKCSSCFAQHPGLRHMDFGAACDRGFYGSEAANDVVMDDLILCEECIGIAARQLGWIPGEEWQRQHDSLQSRLTASTKQTESMTRYADAMEEALSKRPGGEILDHRKRPRLREVENGR